MKCITDYLLFIVFFSLFNITLYVDKQHDSEPWHQHCLLTRCSEGCWETPSGFLAAPKTKRVRMRKTRRSDGRDWNKMGWSIWETRNTRNGPDARRMDPNRRPLWLDGREERGSPGPLTPPKEESRIYPVSRLFIIRQPISRCITRSWPISRPGGVWWSAAWPQWKTRSLPWLCSASASLTSNKRSERFSSHTFTCTRNVC